MLSEADQLLITLAVDGRLTDPEESAFRALVAESSEAFRLFQCLQAQSARLTVLSRSQAPQNLSSTVLARIAKLPSPAQVVVRPRGATTRRRAWFPYAVAASTLLAVTSESYWLAAISRGRPETAQIRRLPAAPPAGVKEVPQTILAQAPSLLPEELPLPRPVEIDAPHTVVATDTPRPTLEIAPTPRVHAINEVVGSGPFQNLGSLTTVDTRLPLLTTVSRFDLPEVRELLLAELRPGTAARLDLFAAGPNGTSAAVELIQNALGKAGLTFAIDGVTAERLKGKLPATYVVYLECLTADELVKVFDHLATLNRAADGGEALGAGHCSPVTATDAKELRDLLGHDLGLLKRPQVTANKGAVQGATVDQVAESLGKPAKGALLTSHLPSAIRLIPAQSPEIRQFLTARPERKVGQVPVMIVIRPQS